MEELILKLMIDSNKVPRDAICNVYDAFKYCLPDSLDEYIDEDTISDFIDMIESLKSGTHKTYKFLTYDGFHNQGMYANKITIKYVKNKVKVTHKYTNAYGDKMRQSETFNIGE